MKRAIVIALLVAAPAARAAGPPPTITQADRGVVAGPGGDRYLAIPDGRDTTVHRVGSDPASATVAGAYGVPAVADDGTASGLSADARTLVLVHPARSFPPKATRMVVLDARTLAVRERLRLRGWFGFDAISPDGRTLYLIQYRRGGLLDYAVRAYDVPSRSLLRKPIVDPREPDEKMTGLPLTRLTSRDGVWDYTLYSGKRTFVHALDTRDRTARCIDLPGAPADPGRATMALAGRYLRVLYDGTPVTAIDTHTLAANPAFPPRLPVHRQHAAHAGGGGGGGSWRLIGGLGAALALAGLAVAVARRRYATGSVSPE
jgi:hypothetical protein